MTTETIYTALYKFHSSVRTIHKGSINPFFGSKYATLADIQKSIAQPLQDAGLIIVHQLGENDTMHSSVIHCESGQQIQSTYKLHIKGSDSQAWGSAITYAKRYAIGALLNLCIDEDDDGNANKSKPNLPNEKIPDIAKWIKDGKGTLQQIERKYNLTTSQRKQITA